MSFFFSNFVLKFKIKNNMVAIIIMGLLALLYLAVSFLYKKVGENPQYSFLKPILDATPKALRAAALSIGALFYILQYFGSTIVTEVHNLDEDIIVPIGAAILSFIFKFINDGWVGKGCSALFFIALCFAPAYFVKEVSTELGWIYFGFIALWFGAFYLFGRMKK